MFSPCGCPKGVMTTGASMTVPVIRINPRSSWSVDRGEKEVLLTGHTHFERPEGWPKHPVPIWRGE
jgi:hypothetical protein